MGQLRITFFSRKDAKVSKTLRDVYSRAMRVLGIDPGSQTMGWGVAEGDGRRYSLVAFGAIRAPSSLKFSTRLLRMCNGLEEVIAEHRPDACALEDAFLATNVKVSMKLGQVRGVALLVVGGAGGEGWVYASSC